MTSGFSVIIPVYNAEDFLLRAVRSVQEQTLAPLEILMVEDCSTDGTRDVVAKLAEADSRIRLLQTAQNGGPSAARNLGIDAAKGDWIATLDADDAFEPDRLRRLADLTAGAPEPDIVADDLLYYDAGAHCPTGPAQATRGFTGRDITLADYLRHNLADGKGADWGLLKPCFRRDFLIRMNLRYPASMRHGEDFAFMVSLLESGARFTLLDEALYLYTQRSGAISRRVSDLSRTSIAYGALARSALTLAREPGISGRPELVTLLCQRADGLMRLDDAHFFSVAVRRKDIGGLLRRVRERPSFGPFICLLIFRAICRRVVRRG